MSFLLAPLKLLAEIAAGLWYAFKNYVLKKALASQEKTDDERKKAVDSERANFERELSEYEAGKGKPK